ncbi:MAG: efflux RND transporter permease subunit, partial [Alphaproteobacteria bacterium]|nr:efflux RND transporter permease subunit [Alphaproteobacteria bacterium]
MIVIDVDNDFLDRLKLLAVLAFLHHHLQTWRASIIPLAAVPVSLIGTFAVMHLLGFSLN